MDHVWQSLVKPGMRCIACWAALSAHGVKNARALPCELQSSSTFPARQNLFTMGNWHATCKPVPISQPIWAVPSPVRQVLEACKSGIRAPHLPQTFQAFCPAQAFCSASQLVGIKAGPAIITALLPPFGSSKAEEHLFGKHMVQCLAMSYKFCLVWLDACMWFANSSIEIKASGSMEANSYVICRTESTPGAEGAGSKRKKTTTSRAKWVSLSLSLWQYAELDDDTILPRCLPGLCVSCWRAPAQKLRHVAI